MKVRLEKEEEEGSKTVFLMEIKGSLSVKISNDIIDRLEEEGFKIIKVSD